MYFKLIESHKQQIKPSFKRMKYFSVIEKYLNTSFIKVITGQRRVGKSHLMFQIIEHLQSKGIAFKDIIYINKELDSEDIIKTSSDLETAIEDYCASQKKSQNEKLYIFIDEIQDIQNWEKTIRKWRAEDRFEIFITGSNSTLLSSDLATFLSGRFIEIQVFPFDLIETCEFLKCPVDYQALDTYLLYGGMPEVLTLSASIKYDILSSILDSILFRDIVRRYTISNVKIFEKIVHYLALNIGCLFNARNIARFLSSQGIKISLPTILSYVGYLEKAFIMHSVNRYDVKGKSILEFSHKWYFNDLGLRNAIATHDLQYKSRLLENFIYLHLISNGWKVFTGKLGTKEIDFIVQKKDTIMHLQVVWRLDKQEVIDREFGNLLSIKDGHRKLVIGYQDEAFGHYEGIAYMPVLEFLTSDYFNIPTGTREGT